MSTASPGGTTRAVAAIVAALRAEYGDGNVGRGRYHEPPRSPWVQVAGVAIRSEQGPPMRYWSRTATLDIVVWVASASGTLTDRVEIAEAEAERATNAIERAKADPASYLYTLPELAVESAAIGGDLDAAPEGWSLAAISVTLTVIERGM